MTWPLPFILHLSAPLSLSLSLSASPPRSPTQREQTTDIRTQTHTHTQTQGLTHFDIHFYRHLHMLLIFIRTLEPSAVCMRLQKEDFPWGCKVSVFLWIPSNLGTWMNNDYVYLPCSSKVLAQRISTCCIQSWCWDGERKNKKRRKKRKGKKPTKNVARNRRNIRGLFFFLRLGVQWTWFQASMVGIWFILSYIIYLIVFIVYYDTSINSLVVFFKSIIQSLFPPFCLSSRPLIELLFVWPWSTADLIQSGSWALIMFRRHFRRPGICNLKQSSLLGATCQGLCVCPAAHLLVCLLVYQSNCICMLCAKAFGKPYLHCVTNLRTS